MADVFRYPEEQFLLVGKVAKPHGLRGEVKIYAFSDDAGTLLHYQKIVLVDRTGRLTPSLHVENARSQGKYVVFKLESIDDRNSAESIHGMGVLIDKNDLREIEENEYYWYQYYNLPVHTDTGRFLGTITSIFSNGAQDIMVIQENGSEYLVPILDSVIIEHTENGVVITPPQGLLEINSGDVD